MHNILIVDDEKPAREFIAELIAFYVPDAIVHQTDNAYKALKYLQTENYDLLFVDIDLGAGVTTGLELLEEINRMGKQPYTVIISAHYNFDYVVKGMELGAARYIPKPLEKDTSEKKATTTIQCVTKPLYKEKIYEAIKLYLSKIKPETIDLKVSNGVHRIAIDHLLALQTSNHRRIKIYAANAYLPDVVASLSQLYSLLPPYFRYIRRDCVINLHAVKRYNLKYREVVISYQKQDIMFVISRDRIKEFSAWFEAEKLEKDEE